MKNFLTSFRLGRIVSPSVPSSSGQSRAQVISSEAACARGSHFYGEEA